MMRDQRFQRLEVVPLTGALGADVRGVDLAANANDDVFTELRRVLDDYHVIAVRGQKLTPQTFHEVARRFGPFSGNPVHQPMEGLEDVVTFIREPEDTGMVAGENWHMDLAWMEKPPGLTMLYGHVIPPVGGDTFSPVQAGIPRVVAGDAVAARRPHRNSLGKGVSASMPRPRAWVCASTTPRRSRSWKPNIRSSAPTRRQASAMYS